MAERCRSRSEESLKAFDSLKTKLMELRLLWTEWENELKRLEDIASDGVKQHVNTLKEELEAFRQLESKFDLLVPLLSASARLACNQRMEMLQLKFKQLSKFTDSCRLVGEVIPSASQSTRKLTSVNEVAAYVQETEDRVKVLDVLEEVEKAIDTISNSEAALYVNCQNYKLLLETYTLLLHSEEASKFGTSVEPPVSKVIEVVSGVLASCASPPKYQVNAVILSIMFDINLPIPKEECVMNLETEYVKEVISRAELIVARHETNENEVHASLKDMADCEAVLIGWSNKKLDSLRKRWEAKRIELELWLRQMERARQIRSNLEQNRICESQTMDEIQLIEQTCDQMSNDDLKHSLLVVTNQLRVLAEMALQERMDNLKMSCEEDCAVAHGIVKKIGEELVGFCPQLNERNIEAQRVLIEKMELFRRLQNYYDAVKYLRNQNNVWNTITLSEKTIGAQILIRTNSHAWDGSLQKVSTISSELKRLLERCDTEWRNDVLQLRRELVAISGSFFQLEFDRVNEKLNLLTYERDKLRDLMRTRLEYLDSVCDFISFTDSSIDATQIDQSPGIQYVDNYLGITLLVYNWQLITLQKVSPLRMQVKKLLTAEELCNKLEEKAEHLRQLQHPAEMLISDLTIPLLIRRFRIRLLGPIDEDNFDDMARCFKSLMDKELPTTENPRMLLATITELKRDEEIEKKAFDELNELTISDMQKSELDRISALYHNRQDQRQRLITSYTYTYHDYLNSLFCAYEEKVVQYINNRAQAEMLKFNENEWKQWKENVGSLESLLDASMRVRFRPEFADLQRKAFSPGQ
ncbi:CAMSAP CH domain [Parelaphostrongylus tenuis]|uniref:CAMSAP CH domain n=1 Tax=Parelaphostrongylus tenuis TaxID=148309 RepID=A0AAD5RHC7_PARTN|nr:CAMSAP CH domain [Parelaphostrongylus tenuis]